NMSNISMFVPNEYEQLIIKRGWKRRGFEYNLVDFIYPHRYFYNVEELFTKRQKQFSNYVRFKSGLEILFPEVEDDKEIEE
ncbi:hypothetical protein H4219_002452, partial [Mycoemilia scoparia]